ncbi:lethal (2) k09913 [Carabus blaptoides fortunei]
MDSQSSTELYEDIVKISNIIPNVSAAMICSELNKVQDKEDRVLIVLRNYLLKYDVKCQNALRDDIKTVKRVLPDYSIVNITKDLNEVAHEPYRVQIVLKKYLCNENVPVKRRFDNDEIIDLCDTPTEKKRKSDMYEFPKNDELPSLYDAINKLHPGTRKDELLCICTKWNIDMNAIPSPDTVNFVIDKLFGGEKNVTNENLEEPIEVQPVAGPSNIGNDNINDSPLESSTQEYSFEELEELFENQANANHTSQNYKVNLIQHFVPVPDNQSLYFVKNVEEPAVTPEINVSDSPINVVGSHDSEKTEDYYINSSTQRVIRVTNVYSGLPSSNLSEIRLNRQFEDTIERANIERDPNVSTLPNSENILSVEHNAGHIIRDIENDLIASCDNSLYTSGQNTGENTSARTRGVKADGKSNNNNLIPDAVPSTSTGHIGNIPTPYSNVPVTSCPMPLRNTDAMANDDVIITSVLNSATLMKLNNQDDRTPVDLTLPKSIIAVASTSEKCKTQVIDGKSGAEHPFFFKLMEMFPDICPIYLRNLCDGKANNDTIFDDLMNELLNGNYECRIKKPNSPQTQLDFEEHAQNSVLKAAQMLDCFKKQMRAKRKLYPLTSCQNIPLLQEIAYVKHRSEIMNYIKQQEEMKIEARRTAKEAGLMKTCGCCFDDEVMVEDIACCEAGHIFCKDCVRKGCEVVIGQGKLHFPCLELCDSYFSLQILQAVLTPKVFSKMAQRKQLEEVKAAGIEDLEFCPFCDFATIPAPGDKLFRCLNNECMKESCRECHEPSHIPLRCDEVEKEKDVKLRTYIEDKMTEALVRKCYKCAMKFVKEDGCNKMTCSCGAMMCYVCNKPVQDYKHFNGQGGDQLHLCPLYSDTVKLHMEAVKRGAETAKKELGIGEDDKQLKIDPTENLDKHYKEIAKRTKPNPAIAMIEDVLGLWDLYVPIVYWDNEDPVVLKKLIFSTFCYYLAKMIGLRAGYNIFRTNILLFEPKIHYKGQGILITVLWTRQLSSQQITKNVYLVSNEKKKFDRENFTISTNTEKPLVVLLTWLLAKQKHINKFNNIYLEQGFDVLNVSVSPWQILWPVKGTQLVANDVLRFLDKNHNYSPLLLHGFSVGGYVWGEALVHIAQEQVRYKHVVDRICGQIWDSAADITEIPVGMPKAVFPKNAMMQAALKQYILYHMKTFHKVATCHYIRSSQMFYTTVVKAPTLFFLSKSDPVGSYTSNMRVRESYESMNMKVYWKCWEKSPHVSHFYFHPEEYLTEMYNFLEKLELIAYPEKKKIKI